MRSTVTVAIKRRATVLAESQAGVLLGAKGRRVLVSVRNIENRILFYISRRNKTADLLKRQKVHNRTGLQSNKKRGHAGAYFSSRGHIRISWTGNTASITRLPRGNMVFSSTTELNISSRNSLRINSSRWAYSQWDGSALPNLGQPGSSRRANCSKSTGN